MSHYEERINYALAEGFEIKKDGVWYHKPKSSTSQELESTYVCGILYVIAYARDERHENYCKLLEFNNHDGQLQKSLMPQELLAGDGGEVRKALLSKGLKLGEDRKAKELLHRYLLSCDPPDRVRSIDRTGWYGQTYVLPKGVLGKQPDEEVLYLGPSSGQMLLQNIGSAEDWKNSNSTDIMRWDMSVMFAKSYVLQLSDNVKRSLEQARKEGIRAGLAPLSYLNVTDKQGNKDVMPDPDQRHLIVKMFELYATGKYSYREIVEMMKKLGLKNKQGQPVGHSKIADALKDTF